MTRKEAPATTPADTSAAIPHDPGSRARKGGAPRGNLNAAKHLGYLKRARRDQRDAFRRAAERESRAILLATGLERDPLGKRLGRRLTDVETEISRLRSYLDSRGRHDLKGTPRAAYHLYLDLQKQDRSELRQLVERLAEVATAKGVDRGDRVYTSHFEDGTAVTADVAAFGDGYEPDEAQPLPLLTLLDTAPNVVAAQPRAADPPSASPARGRADRDRPVGAGAGEAGILRDRWARGLSPWGDDD